jgi:hypothetical protein
MSTSLGLDDILRGSVFSTPEKGLAPTQHAGFEQMVISELQKLPTETRGPGTLHRIIAEAQRTYLRLGPIAIGPISKYGPPQAVRAKGK